MSSCLQSEIPLPRHPGSQVLPAPSRIPAENVGTPLALGPGRPTAQGASKGSAPILRSALCPLPSHHAATFTGSGTTFATAVADFGVCFAALARFFLALPGFTGNGLSA